MNTLDLNIPLLGIDLVPMPNTNVAQLIATVLVQSRTGPCLKYWDWATALNRDGRVQLDNSDLDHLCQFVESSDQMAVIVKVPVIKAIKALKNA